jgi:hypothetical protein
MHQQAGAGRLIAQLLPQHRQSPAPLVQLKTCWQHGHLQQSSGKGS